MVFKASGARTFPAKDERTSRQVLLAIEAKLNKLLQALDEEEDEDPDPLTLDGSYAGRERDQTQSL